MDPETYSRHSQDPIIDLVTYSMHSRDPDCGPRDLFNTRLGSNPATYLIPWVRRFLPYRNSVLRFDLICQTFVLIMWCCVELGGHLIRKMKTFTSLGPSLIFTLGCSRSISRNSGLPADVTRHLPD